MSSLEQNPDGELQNHAIRVFSEIEPTAFHTPIEQTETMINAVQNFNHDYREEWMLALLQSRIGKIGLEAEALQLRPDLDDQDVHQIAALAILEAACSINPEAKTPVNLRLAQEVPRHFAHQLAETKMMPEYSFFAHQSVISAEQNPLDRAIPKPGLYPRHTETGEMPVEEQVILTEQSETIATYLNTLPDGIKKATIQMRYGLDGHDYHSLREVAEKLDITMAEARRAERKVLAKLSKLI